MNNKIHNAIGSIHAEESLKLKTKAFLKAKESSHIKSVTTRWMTITFACFMLALLGFGGWKLYKAPVSTISVDVNPSIELGVNCFDRIVSVEGYNEDGIEIAKSVDLKNMTYSDGLDMLIQSDTMKAYIDNDGFISITVVGSTEEKGAEMMAQINECAYATGPNVKCQRGNREELDEAHDVGLSVGKYRALIELQVIDPSITADDIRSMTMREIRNWTEKLSGKQSSTPQGNGNGSGGNRKGIGNGDGKHHGWN